MKNNYGETGEQALKILSDATEKAWKIYQEATILDERIRDETITNAFQAYREIETQARAVRDETVASALETFKENTAPAWEIYLKAIEE